MALVRDVRSVGKQSMTYEVIVEVCKVCIERSAMAPCLLIMECRSNKCEGEILLASNVTRCCVREVSVGAGAKAVNS